MSNQGKPITAYSESTFIKAFSQKLPGSDADMNPLAEHTKLEKWDEHGKPYLEEYQGSGKLKNKVALITGGDSGIGRSVAIFFAREGADVSIAYLPEEQKDAEFVRDAVSKAGQKCTLIPTDLEKISECEAVVKKHIDALGRIDVLVNNASKQLFCKQIADIDPHTVKSTFDSNIISMISLTKYAIPHMRRGGSIINTTSVTAYQGSPALIDYSSTKGAIVAFTRSLAAQLAPTGIRVNGVAPGPVYTPLQPASRSKENMEGWELGKVPLHGRAAQPAELGPAFVFAASADSNYMSGNVIHINAGMWVGS